MTPTGWFQVAWSEDVDAGAVHRMHYFGRELVVWRARSGRLTAMDAYCEHLGAHLGHGGHVEGEVIACPFGDVLHGDFEVLVSVGGHETGRTGGRGVERCKPCIRQRRRSKHGDVVPTRNRKRNCHGCARSNGQHPEDGHRAPLTPEGDDLPNGRG
jgi:hypothetical protein